MDPFDPGRFLGTPSQAAAGKKVRWSTDKKSKKASKAAASAQAEQPDGTSRPTSTQSLNAYRWSIICIFSCLFAAFLGAAGPSLLEPDGIAHRLLNDVAASWSPLRPLPRTAPPNRRRTTPVIPEHLASFVREVVRAALEDPVGRRDFALASEGAKIAHKLTTPFEPSPSILVPRPPENVLDEDLRSGSCWAFPSDHAQVGIKLPTFILPTHVTIDHTPKSIAADIRQAPKHMVLWGLLDGKENEERRLAAEDHFRTSPLNTTGDGPSIMADYNFLPLAAFTYDINAASHIQTFPIDSAIVMSRISFGAVVLEVQDNWGASSTRLFRVRIHGEERSG